MARLVRLLLVLFVVGGAVVGGYAWLKRGGGEPGYKEVEVTLGSITDKAVAVGQITPRVEYRVKSKISGIVKTCFVEVGDHVRAGDPLFEIAPDPTPAELVEVERQLQSAETGFARAEADYARVKQLSSEGILARGDLDASREAYDRARIERERAQDTLDLVRKGRIAGRGERLESIIRAQSGGTVLARQVNPGDPVVPLTSYQAGTDLATIADMSDLLFKGTVDEIDVGKLRAGTEARIKIGALPDEVVTGRLSRIAPQAREKDNARLFDVEIELSPGSDGQVVLRAGYSANVDLIIREKKDIPVLPERVVQIEKDGKAFVELPPTAPGGEPRKSEITTGLSDGLNIEVVAGLAAGDKVVERPPREIGG
ncbi:MAG: efflux RND transporter periplasmic adaptor subunit [Acidobacteria bacterium]|nr:efflux RND transporter periplasmic adaptor subunit [Acidobacteriota bacterium]